MFGNFDSDIERKRSVLALLLEMANADKEIEPIELQYIKGLAGNMGMTQMDIQEAMDAPQDYIFSAPADEHSRMTIMYYLLFLMRSNGKIDLREEAVAFKAALKLGFSQSLTQDLINVVKFYLVDEIPPDAMLNNIKKYLN